MTYFVLHETNFNCRPTYITDLVSVSGWASNCSERCECVSSALQCDCAPPRLPVFPTPHVNTCWRCEHQMFDPQSVLACRPGMLLHSAPLLLLLVLAGPLLGGLVQDQHNDRVIHSRPLSDKQRNGEQVHSIKSLMEGVYSVMF